MTGTGGRRWRLVRAGPEAVPASVRRFMRAARRRRVGRAVPWTLAAVAVALAVLAGWLGWASPVLAVEEVRIRGTSLLTEADVREQAAVPQLTPLLRISTEEVAARVAALPPVAEVEVRRQWPDTIVIEVVERTPVAVVLYGSESQLVDATGVVFFPVSSPSAVPATASGGPGSSGRLPVLAVPSAGPDGSTGPDDAATRAALAVLAALTPELRAVLDTLTVAGPAGIELATRSGRTIVWGDENASEEKARVATALLGRDAAVIDVSAPEVVVLR
jgi:cell division protein FtsQ